MNIVSIIFASFGILIVWALASLLVAGCIEDLFVSMPYGLKLTAIILSPITIIIFEVVLAVTIVISIFTNIFDVITDLKK